MHIFVEMDLVRKASSNTSAAAVTADGAAAAAGTTDSDVEGEVDADASIDGIDVDDGDEDFPTLNGSFVSYSMGGGAGLGVSNFDPSSLISDIGSVKEVTKELGNKIEEVAAERLTIEQAEVYHRRLYFHIVA